MNGQPRLWQIVVILLALGALIVLAAGVRSVNPADMSPAIRLEQPALAAPNAAQDLPLPSSTPLTFGWPQILVLVIAVIGLALYARRSPRSFLIFLFIFLAICAYFLLRRPETVQLLALQGQANEAKSDASVGATSGAVEAVSAESPLLTLLVSLAVGAGLVAATALFYRRWRVRPTPAPLTQLALDADGAIADIRAGADLTDVVLRCYADMTHTLARWRGISRPGGMTPREFAQALSEVGLPRRSIERLTVLFENVRYGAIAPAKRDELEAVSCLSEISDAIRRRPQPAPG